MQFYQILSKTKNDPALVIYFLSQIGVNLFENIFVKIVCGGNKSCLAWYNEVNSTKEKMKIAIDVQTTLGQPTGFGFYVSNLTRAL